MALLGCFSDGEWIIDRFAELLHIPAAAARHMKSIHEARHHGKVRWSDFKLARMLDDESIPVLRVHDRKDMEIPYFHAEAFQRESAGRIPLLTTEGPGPSQDRPQSGCHRTDLRFPGGLSRGREGHPMKQARPMREATRPGDSRHKRKRGIAPRFSYTTSRVSMNWMSGKRSCVSRRFTWLGAR
ncbi:hypothetical protein [Ralstonia solanacearum]|uniref:hypothetical protein n=1 Tax=Ralstonia solanacearum TaxID=305 RepID=UPI001E505DD4|nr:hypothetical protein [Ralstonia solanacearum]